MSAAISVISGVEMPKVSRPGATKRRKYPFEDMDVGGMFFVPNRPKNTMTAHASAIGKQLNRKFSTRLICMRFNEERGEWEMCDKNDEGAVVGIGVWRMK